LEIKKLVEKNAPTHEAGPYYLLQGDRVSISIENKRKKSRVGQEKTSVLKEQKFMRKKRSREGYCSNTQEAWGRKVLLGTVNQGGKSLHYRQPSPALKRGAG